MVALRFNNRDNILPGKGVGMKLVNVVMLACLVVAASGCGYKVTIDDNLEHLPREVAIAYLQEESGKYNDDTAKCIYTSTGVNGNLYEDLYYEQNVFGHALILLYHKDRTRAECVSIFVSPYNSEISREEAQAAINKTCSALESLGVKRGRVHE